MRRTISAQSWASAPPAPALTVTSASPPSYSPVKRRSSSRAARRSSTEASVSSISASMSGSSSASSTRPARSDSSAASLSYDSRRRWTRAYSALTLAAASGSSQKPGSPMRASSAPARDLIWAGSKVVREQGHLLAAGGEALGDRLGLRARHRAAEASAPAGPRCALQLSGGPPMFHIMGTTHFTGQAERYRLVTRSDFDGLVCAALLKQLGMLDDILFVHPKDMQDGKVELTDRDITTNLPYVPGVHLAFDHHDSEVVRVGESPANHIIDAGAASAARVVYDHFGGAERFPTVSEELMEAVDKADSAQFSEAEILDPKGWIFLSFLMDPRTGLGRFRDFRISNYELMMQLI